MHFPPVKSEVSDRRNQVDADCGMLEDYLLLRGTGIRIPHGLTIKYRADGPPAPTSLRLGLAGQTHTSYNPRHR